MFISHFRLEHLYKIKRTITKKTPTSPGCLINSPADSKLLYNKPDVCIIPVLNSETTPKTSTPNSVALRPAVLRIQLHASV